MPHKLLRMKDVKARTGLSGVEIYRRIRGGLFPKPIPLGLAISRKGEVVQSHLVGWIEDEIDMWIDERIRVARGPVERQDAQSVVTDAQGI